MFYCLEHCQIFCDDFKVCKWQWTSRKLSCQLIDTAIETMHVIDYSSGHRSRHVLLNWIIRRCCVVLYTRVVPGSRFSALVLHSDQCSFVAECSV